jgi:hypothetical protein
MSQSEKTSFLGIFCLGESRVVHYLFSLEQPEYPITVWLFWKTDYLVYLHTIG